MMTELTTMLGFRQEHSSSFYPQANGQVEAVNKTLKTILKCTINASHSNWHIMLYPTLWAYQTNVKTAIGFSPFQLVHGVEAVTPVECEISSLRIVINVLPDATELEGGEPRIYFYIGPICPKCWIQHDIPVGMGCINSTFEDSFQSFFDSLNLIIYLRVERR